MNLSDAHKQQISAWLEQGLKIADVQKKMSAELGVSMTYMEVRFLLDDMRLKPKDPEPPKQPPPSPSAPTAAGLPAGAGGPASPAPESAAAPPLGAVKLSVDTLARPGTVVSGKVKFSDGQTADWYLDQMGRMGVVPAQQGYKPSQPDVLEFQELLQMELQKLGF